MHMADALVSPAVGGTMTVVTGAIAVYCAKKVKADLDQSKVPLMGVLGAFIFAAQMVNFSIPGTGSSGHLGGGMILAILLGPYAAFLVMASVLGVQALFFADGGLLALGANVFNLGFFPAFIAYPLIYRRIVGRDPARNKLVVGAISAAVVGLLLGALGVVFETTASGISALPFAAFTGVMLPIHLAIGIVEGLVTAGVVLFVKGARPELLERVSARKPLAGLDLKPILVGLLIATIVAGGALSWFASSNPDGLEWSIGNVTGAGELAGPTDGTHGAAASVQEKTALLPGYGFKDAPESRANAGTSVSGIVGGALTLGLTGLIGFALKRRRGARSAA
ncbi:MAG: cobalamin biosynthesis protein CbiM [Actinobacteria bacterium]|nr:MAG: cobalamin biosynthesis protein CbiM [Actinomycetota bacterium]